MRIIKPSYEILSDIAPFKMLQSIESAGRTCYKSKMSSGMIETMAFIRKLIENGHESVLEHEKITVKFIVDRGVSHELVRHRIASFSQESTRYCNYTNERFDSELTFILPPWFTTIKPGKFEALQPASPVPTFRDYREHLWLHSMSIAESVYDSLISSEWTPQQARTVLPNSLKTEIVVTANLREWRLILKQRTSNKAHPQMVEVMRPLLKDLAGRLSPIFDDIPVYHD